LKTAEGIFVYSGDTGDCTGIRQIVKGADYFLSECSSRVGNEESAKEYGHLNPRLAGEIAVDGGIKKLILSHYTGLDTDEEMIEDCRRGGFRGEIIIAKDLQTIDL